MNPISNKVAWLLMAGWLAEALAGPDGRVESSIEAYEAGDHERALELIDAAIEARGERAELHLNRGLYAMAAEELEVARKSFELATESKDAKIRASAHYELGNLEFDAENYEAAITAYIDALKSDPTHANAKWNLELAKQRQEQKEEEQEEQDQNGDGDGDGDQDQDQNGDGDGDGDQDQNGDGDGDGDQDQNGDGDGDGDGDQDQSGDGDGDGDGDREQDQSGDGDGDGDREQDQDPSQGEDDPANADPKDGQSDPGSEDPQQGDQGQQDQQDPKKQPGESPPGQPPTQIERAEIGDALEELDAQDNFMLGRTQSRGKAPERDW